MALSREEFALEKLEQLVDSLGFSELATGNHKTGLSALLLTAGPTFDNAELLSRVKMYVISTTAEAQRYRKEDGLELYADLRAQTQLHLDTYFQPIADAYPAV